MVEKRNKKAVVKVGVLLFFIGGILWHIMHTQSKPEMIATPVTVSASTVKVMEKNNILPMTGTVEGTHSFIISSRMSGKIEQVLVDDGQTVKEGTTLFILDTVELSNAVRIAESNVRQALAKYKNDAVAFKRQEMLYQQGATSRQQMEGCQTKMLSSQAEFDSAQANLNIAQKQMNEANVVSPANGVVANKVLTVGQVVSAGNPLMCIEQMDRVHIVLNVEQKDIATIKMGDIVDIKVDAYPERIFQGKIALINPVAGIENRMFRIKASVDNEKHELKPGMFVQVLLKVDEPKQVLVVPKDALLKKKGLHYVYTIENSRAKKAWVEIGDLLDQNIEIRSGLTVGTIVLTNNLDYVKEGDLLRITEET